MLVMLVTPLPAVYNYAEGCLGILLSLLFTLAGYNYYGSSVSELVLYFNHEFISGVLCSFFDW